MGHLVTVHSFRGGTGKSNLTANLAWLAARDGARVAVLDTDLQSPGAHVVFGTDRGRIFQTLSEFVQGRCDLEEVAIDMTDELDAASNGGRLFLLPSSMKLEAITKILSDGYAVESLNEELAGLADRLELDYILLDTHPGLNRETMLSAAVCDTLALIVRPDQQDFQGTAVLVEVAKRIDVPSVTMIANKVPDDLDPESVAERIREAFGFPVAGILPLDRDVARHGSAGLFAAKFPDHPFTSRLQSIQEAILPVSGQVKEVTA